MIARRTLQVVGDSPYGGGGYLLVRWCRHLLERGWRVEVLATHPTMIEALEPLGVSRVGSIHIPRTVVPGADLVALGRLVALLRSSPYDLVHTYTSTPGFLGRLAGRLAGVPVIHHQAGWPVSDLAAPLKRWVFTALERTAVLASTVSIAVGHGVVEQGRGFGADPGGRLVTIVNGIDPEPFDRASREVDPAEVRRELGVTSDELVIGSTGRLATQKNVHTLVQAFAELHRRLPLRRPLLLLVGDGPTRDRIETQAERLGVRERVRILGYRRDVPRLFRAMDLFALPSLWEGLSISLMEAMACAMPIVTSDIPPNRELIEDRRHGLVVPAADAGALADALETLATDPELARRLGRAADRRVRDLYRLERMLDETEALYERLLASP